jgi:pyruvate dehydrogenase E2 component (dihydrolipoamide acetyltransferase)
MAEKFLLPAVGDTMVEGIIAEWLVAVGDTVRQDQPICEVETDKSTVELTTPFAGEVLALGVEQGGTLAVGEMVLLVGQPGETVPESELSPPADTPPVTDTPQSVADAPPIADAPVGGQAPTGDTAGKILSPLVRRLMADSGLDPSEVIGTGPGGRVMRSDIDVALAGRTAGDGQVLAMPKVRRMARQHGIDLGSISGTGPRGSITVDDLTAPGPAEEASLSHRQKLSPTQKSIIANLTRSVQEIPQFTTWWDLDATNLIAARSLAAETLDRRIPWDALFALLLGPVVGRHPMMTATIDGDDLVLRPRLDLGVAMAANTGLVVPVIPDAGSRSLGGLCDAIEELASKATAHRLSPSDLSGAVLTLNNIGAIGATRSVSVLPPGSTAIISPGRPVEKVRVVEGEVEVYPQLTLSGTFDHRVVDGAMAVAFLADFAAVLEQPIRSLFR